MMRGRIWAHGIGLRRRLEDAITGLLNRLDVTDVTLDVTFDLTVSMTWPSR